MKGIESNFFTIVLWRMSGFKSIWASFLQSLVLESIYYKWHINSNQSGKLLTEGINPEVAADLKVDQPAREESEIWSENVDEVSSWPKEDAVSV